MDRCSATRTPVLGAELATVVNSIVAGGNSYPAEYTESSEPEDDTTTHHCALEQSLANDPPVFTNEPTISKSRRQLSAKLHCLYGVSIDTVRRNKPASSRYGLRSDTIAIHPYARSLVYDLRQHTEATIWGPFLDDGTLDVDWEKLEAIMIILDYNMKRSTEERAFLGDTMPVQDKPFTGVTPNSFVSPSPSLPMEPALPLEAQDPYNVTGTWMRVVCFLDYTELYHFNFDGEDVPEDQPRRPIDTDEAIRMITMKIRVTKVQPPGEDDGQGLPMVTFTGTSASLRPSFDPNANSKLKGEEDKRVGG